MDASTFQDLRREYGDEPLDAAALPADPFDLFRQWLAAATAAGLTEPNAMALSTCGSDGQPHCRIVLLKAVGADGLTFFTNRTSEKGRDLAENPRAEVAFWWPQPRNRQVRVRGPVQRTTAAMDDEYFAARPRGAQFASAASPQSRPVGGRAELEALVDALVQRTGDGPVPRPPAWGGYVLWPRAFEFWQGRTARLHDRFRYERDGRGWRLGRLAP